MSATLVLYVVAVTGPKGMLTKVMSVHQSRQEALAQKATFPATLQPNLKVRRASLKIFNT